MVVYDYAPLTLFAGLSIYPTVSFPPAMLNISPGSSVPEEYPTWEAIFSSIVSCGFGGKSAAHKTLWHMGGLENGFGDKVL